MFIQWGLEHMRKKSALRLIQMVGYLVGGYSVEMKAEVRLNVLEHLLGSTTGNFLTQYVFRSHAEEFTKIVPL